MKRVINIIIVVSLLAFIPAMAFLQEEQEATDVQKEPGVVVEQSEGEVKLDVDEKIIEQEKKRYVDDILISGNTVIDESIIKKMMKTRKNHIFDEEVFLQDMKKVLLKYRDEGYIFAIITKSVELTSEDEDYVYIVLRTRIDEKDKYLVERIDVEGNMTYPLNFIKGMLISKENKTFDENIIGKDINTILTSYQSDGFPDARIFPGISVDRDTHTINIMLSIDEGKRGQVGVIEVLGNEFTKTSTIIREMRVREGEYITMEKLDEIKRRLLKLQVVRYESMELYDTDVEGQVKLVVKVKEQKVSKAGGIIGYNPPTNEDEEGILVGQVDIDLGNLFGTARKLKFHWERKSEDRFITELSFTEPWLFGQPVEAGFHVRQEEDIINKGNKENEYEYTNSSWDVSVLTSFTQLFSGVFKFGQTTISNLPNDKVKDSFTFDYTFGVELETLDIPWNPTRGFKDDLSVTFETMESSPIFHITYKIDGNLRHYFNISKNKVISLRGNGKAVFSNSEELIPVHKHFKLGGAKNLRGFFEDQFNGEIMCVFNNEFRLILSEESFVSVFFDVGACWNSTNEETKNITTIEDISGYISTGTGAKGGVGGGMGYGIGISMKVLVGQINISVAMGLPDLLSDFMNKAKIHAAFETKF